MRNNNIWSVSCAYGDHYYTCEGLAKKQAKELFGRLARDTTVNINNDYLALLILATNGKEIMSMQRVGKGEYSYWNGKKYVPSGREAAQIVANL